MARHNVYFSSNGVVDKIDPFKQVCLDAGWTWVANELDADFLLVDLNFKDGWRDGISIIEYADIYNKPIFMVPHGAKGYLFWDSVYDVDERLTGVFVQSDGEKEILEKGGFTPPVYATGFPWAPVKPYKFQEGTEILFAPIHANKDGSWDYAEQWEEANRKAWEKIAPLSTFYNITVYADLGFDIPLPKNVKYVQSELKMDKAIEMIEKADLVFAQETFAHLALAAGKPTVMIDDRGYVQDDRERPSAYWPYYDPYPVNLLSDLPVVNVLNQLMTEDQAIRSWRDRYIGWNFNAQAVLEPIKRSLDIE